MDPVRPRLAPHYANTMTFVYGSDGVSPLAVLMRRRQDSAVLLLLEGLEDTKPEDGCVVRRHGNVIDARLSDGSYEVLRFCSSTRAYRGDCLSADESRHSDGPAKDCEAELRRRGVRLEEALEQRTARLNAWETLSHRPEGQR